jgi:ureidoacrylate peracid hydrolase
VQPIARVLDAARDAGLFVVYTRQEHNPDLSDAGSEDAPHRIKHTRLNIGMAVTAPDGSESRILVRDTWNTAIVAELAPQPGDVVVSKHRYSAFFGTALDSILRARGIDTLIFTGATTSICVESTVRDATFRDYRCIVLRDCTTELIAADAPRSNHEASLLAIELLFGWTAESDALIGALSGAHRAAAESRKGQTGGWPFLRAGSRRHLVVTRNTLHPCVAASPPRPAGKECPLLQRDDAATASADAILASVIRSSLDCVIVTDEARLIVEFNSAAESTFGYSRDEATGVQIADLIVPLRLSKAHADRPLSRPASRRSNRD